MTPISGWSITGCISGLKTGDNNAYRMLDEQYRNRLLKLAKGLLQSWDIPQASAYASDIVQSTLKSFYKRAVRDLFPKLEDEVDLWKIIVTIAFRKAVDAAEEERRRRALGQRLLDQQPNSELGPEPDLISIEEIHRLMSLLDERHRRIALLKLAHEIGVEEIYRLMGPLDDDVWIALNKLEKLKDEKCTYEKLAELLGIAPATVGRELHLMRKILIENGGV